MGNKTTSPFMKQLSQIAHVKDKNYLGAVFKRYTPNAA